MRYLIALIIGIVGAFVILFAGNVVHAAQDECYGIVSSDRETALTTQSKLAQQWTPAQDILVTGIAFNVYSYVGDTGNFVAVVQGVTGPNDLPDGVAVAGTLVNKDGDLFPSGSVGVGQAFDCDAIPTIQRFDFAAPVSFTGGTTYALIIYHSSPGSFQIVNGWVTHATATVPLEGMVCTGAGCVTDTGWAISDFGGNNYDIEYSIYDQFVDPTATGDKKIDDHILNLRSYLKLSGPGGGLIFGLGMIAIVFAVGLKFQMPFPVLAMFNAVLIGALARAEILPAWILLAGIAVAGFAIVFRLANSGGGTTDEK